MIPRIRPGAPGSSWGLGALDPEKELSEVCRAGRGFARPAAARPPKDGGPRKASTRPTKEGESLCLIYFQALNDSFQFWLTSAFAFNYPKVIPTATALIILWTCAMQSDSRRLRSSFIIAVGALMALGAAVAGQPTPTPKEVSADHAAKMAKGLDLFKKHVRPLLEQKCVRCHGGRSVESDLDLSDRESLLKGGVLGPAIVPGHGKESLLIRLITHAREPHM